MIRTQIHLPEHLYHDAKRVAAEYEMSFAEVVRRSLERTLPAYPRKQPGEWRLPEPMSLGMRCKVDHEEWRLLANEPDYVPVRLRKDRK